MASAEPRCGAMKTVILAGGRGTRLAPYTSVLPKPLLPIGERAILEILVERLAEQGFREVTLCVGYLAHLIQAVFNHGAGRGVEISYVHEDEPLGTAAPLRLVPGLDETFLVMNGDLLTTLDHRNLVQHHREAGNALTIATHKRRTRLDYGVLHLNGHGARVAAYEEKPEIATTVSMGIYVLEPRALEHVPAEGPFDFPDLVHALLAAREPVGAYLYDGFWLDLGRHEDYEAAAAWAAENLPGPQDGV
jgi:NDP-mannose synthase